MLVVVVVTAMSDKKGELVGVKENYVFRHTERADHNVVTTINVVDLDLENSTGYILEIENNGGRKGNEVVATVEVNTSQEAESITIPYETVRRSDMIVPGQTVNLRVFEKLEEPEISDSANVLGRCEVVSDRTVSDGCDARLRSRKATQYLGNESKQLRFRNLRTQEEIQAETHSQYEKKSNAISFPLPAREAISAQPGDLIEIIRPAKKDLPSMDAEKDVEVLIREMHSAMMDMYNDYLERQDD